MRCQLTGTLAARYLWLPGAGSEGLRHRFLGPAIVSHCGIAHSAW